MEDKRTALALFLCIAIVMFYTQIMFPQNTRVVRQLDNTQNQVLPDQNNVSKNTTPSSVVPAQNIISQNETTSSSKATLPNEADISAVGLINITSDIFDISISKLGGRIKSLVLKKYKKNLNDTENLNLVENYSSNVDLPLGVYSNNETDLWVTYSANNTNYIINDTGETVIELNGKHQILGDITKTITFTPKSYLFKVDTSFSNTALNNIALEWSKETKDTEEKIRLDPTHFTLLNIQDKLTNVDSKSIATNTLIPEGAVKWLSINDKYFSSILVPTDKSNAASVFINDNQFIARVASNTNSLSSYIYTGPKDIETLAQYSSFSLNRVVDLGFFAFLAEPLLRAIKFFYSFLGNYGLAIILLTLVIKLAFFFLTKASMNSMSKMQEIQPEVAALRERIKDATQLNQEIMALYKRKGVNPMGGCFPVLIQIPVFFGLYSALLQSFDLRHAPFALWIKDLSAPEDLHLFGIRFPLMIILMGLSMIYQQWTTPSAGMDPTQKKVMMMMPVAFTVMFILFPMPSGLVLYWLVNNIISITQQLYLRGHKTANAFTATLAMSVFIFGFGYILTLL